MDLGMNEILLVLLCALLIYGGRLPEVARSLGRGLATLRRSLQETTESVTREFDAAGLDESLDEPGGASGTKRPRTVRRVAPRELAEEDVSGGGMGAQRTGETPAAGPLVGRDDAPPA